MADTPDPPEAKPGGGDYRGLAMLSTAVAEMVLPALFGVWLDGKYATEPRWTIVGAVLGITGGVAHLLYISRRSAGGGEPPSANRNP